MLPALPDRWKDGKVTGLVARGGFVVDIEWKDCKVTSLKVTSRLGGNLRIRTSDELTLKGGKALSAAEGENTNPYYVMPEVAEPLIKESSVTLDMTQPRTNLYDVDTKAGETYVFVSR